MTSSQTTSRIIIYRGNIFALKTPWPFSIEVFDDLHEKICLVTTASNNLADHSEESFSRSFPSAQRVYLDA